MWKVHRWRFGAAKGEGTSGKINFELVSYGIRVDFLGNISIDFCPAGIFMSITQVIEIVAIFVFWQYLFFWHELKSSMSRLFRRTQFVNCFDLLSVCANLAVSFLNGFVELWLHFFERLRDESQEGWDREQDKSRRFCRWFFNRN